MTIEEVQARRKAWRHLIQCALAEEHAREITKNCSRGALESAERHLMTQGLRLDAAIDALDEMLSAPTLTTTLSTSPEEGHAR